ncbi:hypothetical protein ONZ45_g14944 [Pleurotus djamor]|nr:hypothetical protein ONZ45_g14944 [Pleurotus djamor]
MAFITSIPNELLLAIFREFHLTTLISANGVCREWRNLLPLADIHPIRRALLELYKHIVHETWFLDGRQWVLENLRPFDRHAYVDALLTQHDYLPEQFRIWVLEWPARAAFGGIWPGLPMPIFDLVGQTSSQPECWNLLDASTPIVWTVNCINEGSVEDQDVDFVEPFPGIPITLEMDVETTWVLLDKGRYRDKVLQTCASHNVFDLSGYGMEEPVGPRWVDCLRQRLRRLRWLHQSACKYPPPDYANPDTFPEPISLSLTPWISSAHSPYIRPLDSLPNDFDGET